MSKHTPTQYHWKEFYGGHVLLNQHDEEVLVGYCRSGIAPPTIASDGKDRNFIVRALNAHDDLVAACKIALGEWNHKTAGIIGAALDRAKP